MSTTPSDSLLKTIQKQLPGVDTRSIDPSTSLNALTSEANKQTQKLLSSAQGALSANSSDFLKSFPDAKQLMSKASSLTQSLSSIAPGLAKQLKEANSKIQKFTSDSAGAIQNPTSFVTRNVSDAFVGAKPIPTGVKLPNLLSGLDSQSLSAITRKTGTSIGSSGDFSNVLKSVTKAFTSGFGSPSINVANLLPTQTSSLTSFLGKLMPDIKSSVNTTKTQTQKKDDLLSTAIARSPTASLNLSTKKTNSSNAITSLLNDLTAGFAKISNLIPGDKDKLQEKYLGITSSNKTANYNKYIDSSGNSITTSLGRYQTPTDINKAYTAAQKLLPDITSPSYSQYQEDKDFYDVLVQYAAENSMSDLLNQLVTNEKGKKFYDNRTEEILFNELINSARRGDAVMTETIITIITPARVADPYGIMTTLSASLSSEPSDKVVYTRILSHLGLSQQGLASVTLNSGIEVLSAPACIDLLSSNNAIPPADTDTTELLLNAFVAYA